MASTTEFDVADLAMAEQDRKRISWAAREMPVLRLIEDRLGDREPLSVLVNPIDLTLGTRIDHERFSQQP